MIDETKILTVSSYAAKVGHTTQWIYKLIKDGKLNTNVIDGVIFIVC